ncbi:helix-turn-helix domain-containing protein [Streptomyces antimycoticus]|uniref:helix-turn-helix domain-containing protein n=1 Tax=Streptomyces antimycoticus TaxID=68175 RepID=UPI001F47997A|nr:LysR family transcriptional regulator [Streptomyces antimycoticus]
MGAQCVIHIACARLCHRLDRVRDDRDDLRLLLHIVAEGSITAGARRMHLSLPSASARVRSLEHHGRGPADPWPAGGVRPTPAGTAPARHARFAEHLRRAAVSDPEGGTGVPAM